jgi:hypothetical protein
MPAIAACPLVRALIIWAKINSKLNKRFQGFSCRFNPSALLQIKVYLMTLQNASSGIYVKNAAHLQLVKLNIQAQGLFLRYIRMFRMFLQ